jgi:hypothetical protein
MTGKGKQEVRKHVAQRQPLYGVKGLTMSPSKGYVECALVRRPDASSDQPDTALCRQRLQNVRPPTWCQEGGVIGDASDASRPPMALIPERGEWSGFARPRTGTFSQGKPRKALVTHLPRWWYSQLCLPTLSGHRRRLWWGYATRGRRRHVGAVPVALSTCRRHGGPKQTKSLVTNHETDQRSGDFLIDSRTFARYDTIRFENIPHKS